MSNQQWKKFKENMKVKRLAKGKKNERCILNSGELVVQRLSSSVSGKAQKYSRVGPREFVSFPYEEMTINNIKYACEKHFSSVTASGLVCDVVAGDQGPSCRTLEQLPDTKVIHVRFIESVDSEVETVQGTSEFQPKRPKKMPNSFGGSPSKTGCANEPTKYYPKSLSISEMLKLGKKIEETTTTVNLFTFDLQSMSWSKQPEQVEFSVSKKPFASGGFRDAYKATSVHQKFASKTWVLKKYLPQTLKTIEDMGQTVESHTKKVVQMHHLAASMAANLSAAVKKIRKEELFGELFRYTDIFMGKIDDDFVTVEEFVTGEFVKYINNTGELCTDPNDEYGKKAECLAHFSFVKSDKKLILLDIQGSGANLYDPEVASLELQEDGEILFCAGNLSKIAIDAFIAFHVCNKYCELLQLQKL